MFPAERGFSAGAAAQLSSQADVLQSVVLALVATVEDRSTNVASQLTKEESPSLGQASPAPQLKIVPSLKEEKKETPQKSHPDSVVAFRPKSKTSPPSKVRKAAADGLPAPNADDEGFAEDEGFRLSGLFFQSQGCKRKACPPPGARRRLSGSPRFTR